MCFGKKSNVHTKKEVGFIKCEELFIAQQVKFQLHRIVS